MALNDWPTTVASATTTDAEADSIRNSRTDINQTIVNMNGLINSFGPLTSMTHGQVLKYDSTQDKFLPADDIDTDNQNVFSTISVSGQSDVVADSNADTLTLVAGTNVTITTDAANDTITINSTGGGGNISSPLTTNLEVNTGVGIVSSNGGPGGNAAAIIFDDEDLDLIANDIRVDATQLSPADVNTQLLGSGAKRWRTIYGHTLDIEKAAASAATVVIFKDLPTSDPNVAGQLWSNSGVLTVSSG